MKLLKVPESNLCESGNNWCLPLKSTNSKAKNWKISNIKIPWSMCSRGSSQIIKIVPEMLISGVLLSEKHPKTYQLGLWFFWSVKGTTSILTHFRSLISPRSAPKNKDLPPSGKKKKRNKWFAPVAPHHKNLICRVYMQNNLTCKNNYLCPFLSFSMLFSLLKRIHTDIRTVPRLYYTGTKMSVSFWNENPNKLSQK